MCGGRRFDFATFYTLGPSEGSTGSEQNVEELSMGDID